MDYFLKYTISILLLFLVIQLTSCASQPASDVCIFLNLENCEGSSGQGARRSSAQSLPSVSSAAQFNPANVTHDRGLGGEIIYQHDQKPILNFVTGTGKSGAAIVSSQLENIFFSNRIPELDVDYFQRREKNDQYESSKFTLATSISLKSTKKFSLDMGLIGKYNPDTNHLNPGGGLSVRLGFLTLSGAIYRDDVFLDLRNKRNFTYGIDYDDLMGIPTYTESFNVQTYSVGMNLKFLFLDAGFIKTHYEFYDEDQEISIYSASYLVKKFLLNVAYRQEKSPMLQYVDNQLIDKTAVYNTYGGLQYSLSKSIVLGLHYNYNLLEEMSGSLTLFF